VEAGYPREEAERLISFQQGNHSVRVSDDFMRAATEDGSWALRAVTSGETTTELPAREILRACAEACWACGDPGLQFADTISRWHTCPAFGPITASNPCGEFLHVDNSACNLASINLLRFLRDDGTFDVDGFSAAVETLILAQDVLVSGAGYPTPEIEQNAIRLRQLGLGYTNLGAALLAQGLAYDSDEARAWAAGVTALMTGVAYRRSAELAAALGPFEEFERNREPMMAVLERHRDHLARLDAGIAPDVLSAAAATWDEAIGAGRRHGFRNAQTTLIPPAGTVSLMMDCETTGVEPYYSLATRKWFGEGGWADLECESLRPCLRRLGYGEKEVERLALAARQGDLEDAPGLSAAHRRVFQTAVGPDPVSASGHLRMVAAVQPFVSGGVSKTVNVPSGTTAGEVESIFVEAWRLGLKAVTVFRQGSKLVQPLSPQPLTASPAREEAPEKALELLCD
jgi:ribonucleoside-diphosphate reductase alpha chain